LDLHVNDTVNAFLLVYMGLFPIINPVGCAPIFLGLTRDCSNDERHLLARQVAINGFLLMLGSLIIGSHVLEFFGITLPVVRIAGGLVVTAFGWKLLQAGDEDIDSREVAVARREIATASRRTGREDAFYPLTMPLTVGPGAISVAIALGTQRPKAADLRDLIFLGGAAIAALVAMGATIYVCYRFAEIIISTLGKRGTTVLVRLSAFILLCIGIEIIWSGYSGLLGTRS
jgi:multiple antibiotic resistance protein